MTIYTTDKNPRLGEKSIDLIGYCGSQKQLNETLNGDTKYVSNVKKTEQKARSSALREKILEFGL